MPLIPQHSIFPVKGREAREYLLHLGCSIGSETIILPDHLKMVPQSGSRVTYAVMHNQTEVFRMQHYHLTNRWQIVVPPQYQVIFPELASSYGINTLWKAGVFGSSVVMQQLIGGLPVDPPVAIAVLERLLEYTGHPYDLENVRIALTEETRSEEKEREADLIGN